MTLTDNDADVLAAIDAAFETAIKPEHFADYRHCEECAEHDETLRSHDRDTLRVEHVNNPGWDPLCFCSEEGKAYYMPTLARFALAPLENEHDWYGCQLLFHLAGDGAKQCLLHILQRGPAKSHWRVPRASHRGAIGVR